MSKDPLVYIDDMLESIEAVDAYTAGMDLAAFEADGKTIDAVYRRIELLGEAANRLPAAFKTEHPDIPWRKIIAMRNVLAHEYDDIVVEIIWETIQRRLPELRTRLKRLQG